MSQVADTCVLGDCTAVHPLASSNTTLTNFNINAGLSCKVCLPDPFPHECFDACDSLNSVIESALVPVLANARYVYVASYDGDQFDPNLLSQDRDAIGAVQNAIQNWGKLTLVYQPSDADIIILVTSRPSEDLLAVYDARQAPSGNFLWRVMGRDGLQSGETPLVTQFEKGFESVQKHK